jgi:hypothetical protein
MSSDYNIIHVIKDLVSNNLDVSPDSVVEARNKICEQCEAREPITHICTACGCFLPAKVRILKSDCPMELWPSNE